MKTNSTKNEETQDSKDNKSSFSDKFIDLMIDYKLIMITIILILILISQCD